MAYTIRQWENGFSVANLNEVADLWNANAEERHAFFPWSGLLLASQLSGGRDGLGKIVEARVDGALAGLVHVTAMNEEGYPPAGSIEMIMVDARFRRLGIGAALMREGTRILELHRPRLGLIDALGAWPFGYAYNALADGSERSGVFLKDAALYRLFRRAGFEPVRKSMVMRARLAPSVPRPRPSGGEFYIGPRRGGTWLDRVFRGRELWDHELLAANGAVLSRAIYGFMERESRREKTAVFSLFGVNTPRDLQGNGYASMNIAHLMEHVRGLGGEAMELHVYADNKPAVALYGGLGFEPLAETMMMHKHI